MPEATNPQRAFEVVIGYRGNAIYVVGIDTWLGRFVSLAPDEADALADELKKAAAEVRERMAPK